MNKKYVYIVRGHGRYSELFTLRNWHVTDKIEDADLVQFTGGEDVTPELYGHTRHATTGCNPQRDQREMLVFKKAQDMGIPMAGICRGGQFLNVMCGGTLWQDVDGHGIGGTHEVRDLDADQVFQATSTHHQMMIEGPEGKVVAVAARSRRKIKQPANGKPLSYNLTVPEWEDVESVFYLKQAVLCFQPHPEFMKHRNGQLGAKYFELLERYLGA